MFVLFTAALALLAGLTACQPTARAPRTGSATYVYPMSDSTADLGADVNGFCPFDQAGRPQCPPGPEMAWRLRNYAKSLDSYLRHSIERGADESHLEAIRAARARVDQELAAAAERSRRQAELVGELNQSFNCRITAYDKGQQINFARELSLPECDPLVPSESARAAELLNALAEASLPVDAEVMHAKAKMFTAVGGLVKEIAQYKQQLLDLKVIHAENGRAIVDRIGHPFQRDDDTKWLEAYIQKVRKLDRELERLGEPNADVCPRPACDPMVYRLAEAVTLKPPLDWTFLREGDAVMPPTAYGLSYFSGRYDANGDVRFSLQLGSNREWHWDSQDYVNMLTPEDNTLTFTRIFAAQDITLSIANWQQHTEFPNVLPIFYLFQEARRVVELVKSLKTPVAEKIRDVQFAEATNASDFASVTRAPEGLRLNLSVLHPPGDRSIAEVRHELLRQIPAAIEKAAGDSVLTAK